MSQAISNLRFLELSLPCEDVLHTLEFFQQLGFSSIRTNDIWDYPYAVISDGRCYLGLHQKENFDSISNRTRFAFAHNDVAAVQRTMADNDHRLLYSDLDSDDSLQHCLFAAPCGLGSHILAARPFSPLSEPKQSVLGYFRTYLIPNGRATESIRFWENLGQLVLTDEQQGIHISSQNFNAITGEFANLKHAALLFEHPDPDSIFATLARYAISVNMPEAGLPMGGHFSVTNEAGIEFIVKRETS